MECKKLEVCFCICYYCTVLQKTTFCFCRRNWGVMPVCLSVYLFVILFRNHNMFINLYVGP